MPPMPEVPPRPFSCIHEGEIPSISDMYTPQNGLPVSLIVSAIDRPSIFFGSIPVCSMKVLMLGYFVGLGAASSSMSM